MKTKTLAIILSSILLITLAGAGVVFLTKRKVEPVADKQVSIAIKQTEPAKTTSTAPVKNIEPKKAEAPQAIATSTEEKINAVMIIAGVKYEMAIKPGASAYDLMSLLKAENKINFSGKNYSGLGFFVEEINSVKNDPAGKNWVYYVNGRPAQVGSSNYLINNNDLIEWKYEKKLF